MVILSIANQGWNLCVRSFGSFRSFGILHQQGKDLGVRRQKPGCPGRGASGRGIGKLFRECVQLTRRGSPWGRCNRGTWKPHTRQRARSSRPRSGPALTPPSASCRCRSSTRPGEKATAHHLPTPANPSLHCRWCRPLQTERTLDRGGTAVLGTPGHSRPFHCHVRASTGLSPPTLTRPRGELALSEWGAGVTETGRPVPTLEKLAAFSEKEPRLEHNETQEGALLKKRKGNIQEGLGARWASWARRESRRGLGPWWGDLRQKRTQQWGSRRHSSLHSLQGAQYGGPTIYAGKNMIRKDTRTPMFLAALFTVVGTWKQPKCPLTGEWIKKMWWYIYTMEYYSAIKRIK